MRKVWRVIADSAMSDMNPIESDNKLVTHGRTYHSWFACPLLDHQADSRARVRNGGPPLMPLCYRHLDLPKHIIRNVSRFCLRAHTLAVESSIWRSGNGHCDKCSCAPVPNEVHVLFHCQDLSVCYLRKKYSFLLFPFCLSFPVEAIQDENACTPGPKSPRQSWAFKLPALGAGQKQPGLQLPQCSSAACFLVHH